jgi:hypothetical protein
MGITSSLGVVERMTFSAFCLWEGLSGQGASLTLSLVIDDVEMSGHVEMVGSVVHAHPRLSPSCWAHLFLPNLPNMWKAVLNANTTLTTPLSSKHKSLKIILPAHIPLQ